MPNEECVYVVSGRSESGDDFGPFVFRKRPTDAEKKKLIHERMDWSEDDGPGDYGSYTYLSVTKTLVE
jgi:hypothetical protein